MPSEAHNRLIEALGDVDELILAHQAVTGGGRGRPRQRQGAAITRAGVVLLSAAMESFFERIFEEAAPLVYDGAANQELQALFRHTSKRLNHPSWINVTVMFFSIGMNHPLEGLSWQGFSNSALKSAHHKLVETRGQIAHGGQPRVQLSTLRKWKNMVARLGDVFEAAVADHVEASVGVRPTW